MKRVHPLDPEWPYVITMNRKAYERLVKIEAAAGLVVGRIDEAGFAADSTIRALREALAAQP